MLTSVKVCCVQAEENISFKSKKQQSVSLSIKIDAECFYSINQTKLKYFDLLAFSVMFRLDFSSSQSELSHRVY